MTPQGSRRGPGRITFSKSHLQSTRRCKQFRAVKVSKLKESVGVVHSKKFLRSSLLNVDGLNETSLADVQDTVNKQRHDVVILLETKRRAEEIGIDIAIPGYSLHEARRSNNAGDRDGGGIAVYTKLGDGLLFKRHTPNIADPDCAFVNNERVWVTVESQKSKTAICGLYFSCQQSDDRYGKWNDTMYSVVQQEAFALRSKGFRVVYLGDFNGHVGNHPDGGIIGNTPGVNANGRRLLNFLSVTDSVHINGLCRIPGDWSTRLTTGLWTRQRCGHSSIIDYALISKEHINTVISMSIDDHGVLGGGSDHNWLVLDLEDKFIQKKRITNQTVRKDRWDIKEDQDWSGFKDHVNNSVASLDLSSVDNLASSISASVLAALTEVVGLKSSSTRQKPKLLPPELVKELELKRHLEKNWKSLASENANSGSDQVTTAEQLFNDQKTRVADLLLVHRSTKRSKIKEQCSGPSPQARKFFWSHVSPSKKQTTDLSAVVDPVSGVVKCDVDEIKLETEHHLTSVFQGSFVKIPPVNAASNGFDHNYTCQSTPLPGCLSDHSYSIDPSPSLPSHDSSGSIELDPSNWMNTVFSVDEVKKMLTSLKNGKARGWDRIPNEALKNLPESMIVMVTLLFNKIKSSGILPKGWNKGRVTLVHKRGLRELLGNYRPITVLISLSALYSKVLNERLSKVVEEHKLLGEIQNGFRKDRCGADNNFVLDTILWKARSSGKHVHMGYIDISKAYDSINRGILWQKLSTLGINGEFLSTLKSLYTDDSIDCVVNGLLTRPIFLRRGLRQGCALSPLLFALYIMDVGNDIFMSELGFMVGSICVSGLLFADDLVLTARSGAGLKTLLAIVHKVFDKLKLTISFDKSQVISPDDDSWDILNASGDVVMSLEQVELYKYLGTWTYNSMYKTGVEKQKLCVKVAHKYKSCCIHVSKMGPDTVDVVLCTWSNVAIPAILTGCEMIPFCETRIIEIERVQSQVAKFALGISSSSPNVCAQTELGLKPFRQLLYERQLKFYFRVLYLPADRWVHQALLEHLSGGWTSPYLMYISSMRTQLGLFSAPHIPRVWKRTTYEHFIAQTNSVVTSNPWIMPLEHFARCHYVCESEWSTVITQFKLDVAGLGDKQPRPGHFRKPFCPICPVIAANSGIHLLFSCGSLAQLRSATGISSYMNLCKLKNISYDETYRLFVNGFDSNSNLVSVSDYLERGRCMSDMRELWLSKW